MNRLAAREKTFEGQRQGLIRRDDPGLIASFIAAAFFGVARCIRGGRLVDRKRLDKAEPLVWAAIRA